MGRKVLAVDDSRAILARITATLTEAGFDVIKETSARAGLKTAKKERPDIILTDLEMPEMSGIDFCRLIKADQFIAHTPVLMLTSKETKEALLEGISAGADDYIGKSTDPEILVVKVNAVIRQKDIQDKLGQLKKLEAVKAMVTTYNHEFNNPLSIIFGMLELTEKKLDQCRDEEFQDYLQVRLQKVRGASERIKELVGEISKCYRSLETADYDEHDKMVTLPASKKKAA